MMESIISCFKIYVINIFVCMRVFPACMYYIDYVPLIHRDQMTVLDPLELELKVAVSHHIGTEK